MGLPVISVEFKKLAATALSRSVRGILAVVIQDTTSGVTWNSKAYTTLEDVDSKEFTASNYTILSRAFAAAAMGGSSTRSAAPPARDPRSCPPRPPRRAGHR